MELAEQETMHLKVPGALANGKSVWRFFGGPVSLKKWWD